MPVGHWRFPSQLRTIRSFWGIKEKKECIKGCRNADTGESLCSPVNVLGQLCYFMGFMLISENFHQNVNKKAYKNKKKCVKLDKEKKIIAERPHKITCSIEGAPCWDPFINFSAHVWDRGCGTGDRYAGH